MPDSPFLAQGVTVQFGSDDVGGLTAITLPDQQRGDVKVTNNTSAGDHEYTPGIREGGNLQLEAQLIADDAGQGALRTNFNDNDGTKVTVTVTLPSRASASGTVTYTFTGYCNALGGELPQDSDDPGTFTASVKVDGNVTKATA